MWDGERSGTLRLDYYPSYKGNRPSFFDESFEKQKMCDLRNPLTKTKIYQSLRSPANFLQTSKRSQTPRTATPKHQNPQYS